MESKQLLRKEKYLCDKSMNERHRSSVLKLELVPEQRRYIYIYIYIHTGGFGNFPFRGIISLTSKRISIFRHLKNTSKTGLYINYFSTHVVISKVLFISKYRTSFTKL